MLINRVPTRSTNCKITIFAHSHGAAVTYKALSLLTDAERQRLHVMTFGAGTFIPETIPQTYSCYNYLHTEDYISRLANTDLRPYLSSTRSAVDGLKIDETLLEDAPNVIIGLLVPCIGCFNLFKEVVGLPLSQPELAFNIQAMLHSNLSLEGATIDKEKALCRALVCEAIIAENQKGLHQIDETYSAESRELSECKG
jgi:hypothetical protein